MDCLFHSISQKPRLFLVIWLQVGNHFKKKISILYILIGSGTRYTKFVSNIQMREVILSINFVHNYLEGYDRMLERQNFEGQENMFQVNMAKLHPRIESE